MNKEQQIAEMAKIIFDYVDNLKQKHVYVLGNDTAKEMREYSHNQGIAEYFYKQGYRKEEQIRTETARDVLRKFLIKFYWDNDYYVADDIKDTISEIAKEYGIKIEE